MRKILLTFLTALLCSITAWAANGDVLFTQSFGGDGVGSLAFTQNVAYTKASGLAGVVGNANNLFTSITTNNKNSTGIAINNATGGNSASATGIFQAYFNNTSGYWSAVRTNDFAVTAPTAIKVTMDFWISNAGSSSSATALNFAIGDGFTESLKNSSAQATANVHSGFGITSESNMKMCAYNTYGTKIYNTALTQSSWYSLTWIINNTGDSLTYDNPTGSGTTTLANDKFDIWLKTQAGTASTYTKVASAVAATTASKDLQEIYIGSASGKKHELRLDNIVVTDLTPDASCSVSSAEAGANKTTTAETGVALAATAAGTGKTGTWSITSKPDGSSASASSFSSVNSATATFTPDKVGNYTLTWTVECDEDDTETASDNMTVTANCIAISPTLSYASVGGTTLDVGDSSSGSPTVSGNTGSGSVSYAVTTASPAGCLTVNVSTGVASAIAAGSATVTATIVASGNYCGNTATANFTIADDCTDPGLTITLN